MNATTRIRRPTTATPRKLPSRMVHQSTQYAWVPLPGGDAQGPVRFIKVAPGVTYRRPA